MRRAQSVEKVRWSEDIISNERNTLQRLTFPPEPGQVMAILSSPVRRSLLLIGQPGVVSRPGQDWRPAPLESELWQVWSCNITHNFPSLSHGCSLVQLVPEVFVIMSRAGKRRSV